MSAAENFAATLAASRPDQCNRLNRAAVPCDRRPADHDGQHQGTEVGGGSVSWGDDEPAPTAAALAYVSGQPEMFSPVLDERTPAFVVALAGQPLRLALDSIVAHLREPPVAFLAWYQAVEAALADAREAMGLKPGESLQEACAAAHAAATAPPLDALLAAQRAFLLSRGWTEVEPTGAKTFFTSPKLRASLTWRAPNAAPSAKLLPMDSAVTIELILDREGAPRYREALDFFLLEKRPEPKKKGKR